MKSTLKTGLVTTRSVTVDESRVIGFMGRDGAVYATPRMVSDVEYACRDFLLEQVWSEDELGSDKNVAVYIRRLRQKIERDPNHPQLLLTVRGFGYRLADPSGDAEQHEGVDHRR